MHPLASAREARGWSQERLAKRARTTRSIVTNLETGRRDFSGRALIRIFVALGASELERAQIVRAIYATDDVLALEPLEPDPDDSEDADEDTSLDLPVVRRRADIQRTPLQAAS